MKNFIRIMKKDLLKFKWYYVAILILAMLDTIPGMVGPEITSTILNAAIKGKLDMGYLWMILDLLAIYVLATSATYAKKKLVNTAGYRLIGETRKKIFNKVLTLDIAYFEKHSSQEIMTIFTTDTHDLRELFGHLIPDYINCTISLVAISIIMFNMNWKMAMVGIAPGLLIVLACYLLTKKVGPLIKDNNNLFKEQNNFVSDAIQGIREIILFNKNKVSRDKVSDMVNTHVEACLKSRHYGSMFTPVCSMLSYLGEIGVMIMGAYLMNKGEIDGKIITAFLLYLPSFYNPCGSLVDMWDCTQSSLASVRKISDLLMEQSTVDKGYEVPSELSSDPTVEFDDVSFKYEDELIIKGFTAKAEANKMLAIVGPTGSGKSTLMKLIARFYEPGDGSIRIGGTDIRDIPKRALHHCVTPVMQDMHLFNDTIFNNIKFAVDDATDEEVVEAAKLANIHDDIMSMSNGYDTVVGERGVKLSGGQKQRVAIARALLRKSPIILLDEATSALDNRTEKEVQKAISNLSGKKTIIVIAHRLTTIENADSIIYLKDGDVVEQGTHNELMRKHGEYYAMQQARQ